MSPPKKTILLIRNAYSFDFGGGERFPVSLAEELRSNGLSPIIISRSPKLLSLAKSKQLTTVKGWWWHRQNFSGIYALLFPVYLLWQVILFFWYVTLILRFNPSVLHPQSRDDFVATTLAGRLFGKRIIWTDHADLKYIWQNHAIWYKNPVGKLVYFCSQLAHHITLVSKSEQRLIETTLGRTLPRKFSIIHNGVNDLPTTLKNATNSDSIVTFVATSRLVSTKGLSELIEAFKKLGERETALWLLGEGPDEEKFRAQAANMKNITFLGFPKNALSKVARADVFVHPSYHEGFSISLVEAAMLGKPIVACNVGGNSEIIRNGVNGVLVAPRDSTELEGAMRDLLEHPDKRKKMGTESRKIYLSGFVFSTIVKERFLPLYEE